MKKVIACVVCVLLVIILVVYGYVANIVKLFQCDFKPPFKAEVSRMVGISIWPAGVITGYIDIEDGREERKI